MKNVRILVLLCLVAALTIGMALSVGAEESTDPIAIDEIWITFPQPEAGAAIPSNGEVLPDVAVVAKKSVPYDESQELPGAIASVTWEYENAGGVYDAGRDYGVIATITLAEGYTFNEFVGINLNGAPKHSEDGLSGNEMTTDFLITVAGEVGGGGEQLQPIWGEVYAGNIPMSAPAGETAASYSFDGDGYQITGDWYFYNYADKTWSAFSGEFAADGLYGIELTVTAKEGFYIEYLYGISTDNGSEDVEEASDGVYKGSVAVPGEALEGVEDVRVSGIPAEITAGQTAGAVTLTTENGANLSAQWMDAEGNPVTGTFEEGKVYYLQLTVTPKEGGYLNRWLYLYNDNREHLVTSRTNGISVTFDIRYSLLPKVSQVDITGVTGAVIGQAPTTEGIKAPENAHYVVDVAQWRNDSTGEEFTVFADGNKYRLYVYVAAADGYEFTEDVVVTVNGQVVENPYIDYAYIEIPLTYSFLKQIDKVDITIPAPEIGQTATLEGIVLPEGMELDTNSSYWYEWVTVEGADGNESYQEPVTGAFQKGHKYYLSLSFYVKTGYEFTDDAEIYCNGNLADGYNETYGNLWEKGGYLETCYSFRDIINKVEITGVPTPAVGQTATVEGITITGVGEYEIYWIDEDSEGEERFTGTFETGKAYYLYIAFDTAEGTDFADDLVVTVNGKELEDDYWASNECGDVSMRYSFKTVIDKIEITGLPQFSVGATASVGSLKGPEGANYTVMGMWNDPTGDDSEAFTGTFKADGTYVLYVGAEPKAGYEFAEDLQFLIDGKAPETAYVYIYQDGVVAQYYFAPSYEEVGKLELTVKDPVIGETFKSGDIETPEGAKYSLYGDWFVSTDGENWKRVSNGTFEEGKYYAMTLYAELRGSDKVWFGNNPQASVNGVDVVWDNDENYASFMSARIMYKTGKLCAHTYGDWTSVDGNNHSKTCSKCGDVVTEGHAWHSEGDVKCSECGYEREINPPTGDMIVSACLLALCSATALVVIKRRKF